MADFKNEQDYYDSRLRSYLNIPEQSELESLSDIQLAAKQSELTSGKSALIIIQNEWRRREKLESNNLNRKLIETQNQTNKKLLTTQHELNKRISQSQNRTIILASLIGILGVAVGFILTNSINTPEAPDTQQTIIHAPPEEGHLDTPVENTPKAITVAIATEHVEQGGGYHRDGYLFQAVNASRRDVVDDLDHHNLYRNLAVAFSELWLLDEAITELKNALNRAPDDVLLHVELGILYLVDNTFDLAEQELTAALAVDPAFADAYYYLGEVFFQTGQYTLSWYAMETARKLGHHGRMLSEKLQVEAASAEPSQYPWERETPLIAYRQAVLATQIDAESFLSHYQRDDLFSDIMISKRAKQVLPSGFAGNFTATELQSQVADALLRQKPYGEPVIVATGDAYHVVQRVLVFDLANWKQLTHEKTSVHSPDVQSILPKDIEEVPLLCVAPDYIDLQKRRVYAGAFVRKKDAVSAVNTLRGEDFPAFCWETTGKDKQIIYNAVAGQFASFVEAESVLKRLKEKGYLHVFISRKR